MLQNNNFNFYCSNKLEILAEKYSQYIYGKKCEDNFLAKDYIIVPTIGISSYLKLFLAEKNPISANLEVLFINQFVNQVFQNIFSDFRINSNFFSCESMSFDIYNEIQNNLSEYEQLKTFISSSDGKLKCYQLSNEIAKLFDKYFIYRADILKKWRENKTPLKDSNWQQKLFTKIFADKNRKSYDQYFHDFFELNELTEYIKLPKSITIFGISSMSPLHLAFFHKLSCFMEVNFFYLNPCEEYWAEIATKKRKKVLEELDDNDQYLTNAILSSLGEVGRSFFNTILNQDIYYNQELNCFEDYFKSGDYQNNSILNCLQTDILKLKQHNFSPIKDNPDNSIIINSCHSSLREVEVLLDQLKRVIANNNIMPRDIIVMAPDINKYASSINAVFSESKIPYSISDRNLKQSTTVMLAFSKLLTVGAGRFEANDVIELLSFDVIYKNFSIKEEDLEKIKLWINHAKISWGINGKTHEKFCDVNYDDFTWESGKKRLLLGMVLDLPEDEAGYWDVLPIRDGIDNPVLLGNFLKFLRLLFNLSELQRDNLTLSNWCQKIDDIISNFIFENKDTLKDIAIIRNMLEKLKKIYNNLSLEELKLPYEIIKEFIENNLVQSSNVDNFLRGKITFCSMVPMRSIPMKLVGILGLNNNEFPRKDNYLGFDISAKNIMKGDKSRAAEDRYLFLEAILSARKYLYLSYQGQNIKNKDKINPCVPLSELYDYLNKFYGLNIQEQALWAFDERYFTNNNSCYELSYFKEYKLLAEELRKTQQDNSIQLKPLEKKLELNILTTNELTNALENHPAWYLKNHANLFYNKYDENLTVNEPSDDDWLNNYIVRKNICEGLLKGVKYDIQYNLLRKQGLLAVGVNGKNFFDKYYSCLEKLPPEILEELREIKKIPLEEELNGIKLTGTMNIYNNKSYQTIFSSLKWKYAIRANINHLFINANGNYCDTYILELKDKFKIYQLSAIDKLVAKEKLAEIVSIYLKGYNEPLPIFEMTSNFVATCDKDLDYLRTKAKEAFFNNYNASQADVNDIPTNLLFGYGEIFNDDEKFERFCQLSKTLYPTIKEVK